MSKPKPNIAILFSGEYRTFKYCRKTMLFLDQDDINVDIYFSTWNETATVNPIPTIPLTRHEKRIQYINKEVIEQDLGQKASTQALPIDESQWHIPYIIRSWMHGCDLLLASGKTYDYVFQLRPDLFFHPGATIDIDQLDQYNLKTVGVSENVHNWTTTDVNMFATFEDFKNIFNVNISKLISKNHNEAKNGWHENWYDYIVNTCKLKIASYPIRAYCHIARFPLDENSKLSDVQSNEQQRMASTISVYDADNFVLIFDLDGVLMESKDMHFQTLNSALGKIFPEAVISVSDQINYFEALPTKKKLQILTQNKNLPVELYQDIIDLKNQATWEWIKENIKPDPDLRLIFNVFRGRIAVASNSIRKTVEIALRCLELDDCVKFYISNEDVDNPKPDPEMFMKCMEQLEATPQRTIIIEDSEVGCKAATASGAHLLKVQSPKEVTLKNICSFINDNKLNNLIK